MINGDNIMLYIFLMRVNCFSMFQHNISFCTDVTGTRVCVINRAKHRDFKILEAFYKQLLIKPHEHKRGINAKQN